MNGDPLGLSSAAISSILCSAVGQRRLVAAVEVPVERRVGEDLRALERGDGLGDLRHRDVLSGLAEDLPKRSDVVWICAHDVEDWLVVGETHLDGVHEGVQRLVLEARRASVPEHRVEVGGVQNRRRVAGPGELVDALRGLARAVRERLVLFVAGRAADLPCGAEPLVVEQLVPECDLLGSLRVVLRDRHRGQAERKLRGRTRRDRHDGDDPHQSGQGQSSKDDLPHVDSSLRDCSRQRRQTPRSWTRKSVTSKPSSEVSGIETESSRAFEMSTTLSQ